MRNVRVKAQWVCFYKKQQRMYMEYKNNVNGALNRLSALYQNGVEYFEEPCDLETNGELENHNQAESFRTKTRKD